MREEGKDGLGRGQRWVMEASLSYTRKGKLHLPMHTCLAIPIWIAVALTCLVFQPDYPHTATYFGPCLSLKMTR